jgi:hypothetical protein
MDQQDQQTDRKSVTVVFDRALVDQIDDWRRRQREIPTVAEGVRRLVARGIAHDEHTRA